MKKRLSLLLLSIFVLPVFALFGCDEVASFGVTVYSSSETLGAVSGYGTFDEGTSVTLTATPKSDGRFVAWVYQSEIQLSDGETYKIETTDAKSTLTFTMTATTSGSYTAVFENKTQTQSSNMMYIKLSSYRFVTAESYEQTPEGLTSGSENLETAITTHMIVSHGKTSNSLIEVLNLENTELKDNLIYTPEAVNQVLNLDAYSARHLCVQIVGRIGNSSNATTKELRANIEFKENTQTQNQGYVSNVTYSSNGTYQITFAFAQEGKTYYLILTYENLTATTPAQ